MRSFLIMLVGITSTTFCFAASTDTIPSANGLIEYTGRIDFSNPNVPVFSYSGVSIRAYFTGTSIAMIMDDNGGQNYYNLILDGQLLDTVKITSGKKTYKIADGLKNSIHEIEIFKRTEQQFGKTQFFGFVVDKGSSLTTIENKRTKMIEFIGNSITCGYGNEGVNGGKFGPTTENHYMTYAAITSRNFNARHLAVCKSGIGIYRNYDGPKTGNTDCMTNYYTRIFLYDENPKYTFSKKPELVCIDLGTNDFSTTGADSAKFVSNYFRLIDTIQLKYSKPEIICLLGPMISDPTLSKIRKYLKAIADSGSRKGKGNVYFFEMSPQTGALGIDYHPTVAQHIKNGMELTNYIKTLKNWKINPLIINANVAGIKHLTLEFNTPVRDSIKTFSGFSVFGNNSQYTINNAYSDTLNKKIVHLFLQQSILVGEKITVNYIPGSLQSSDSISVGEIKSFIVQNNLTETKITKAVSNTDGTRVTLTCNKTLKKNSSIDGFKLINSRGIVKNDSLSTSKTLITLFLNDTVKKADTVFVSFTGDNFLAVDEIPLSSFSKMTIKNNSISTSISANYQNSLKIYPNPNHTGVFNYRFINGKFNKTASLDIIGSNGVTVLTQILTTKDGEINLPGKLAKGIYFFRFTSDNSVFNKSILIE